MGLLVGGDIRRKGDGVESGLSQTAGPGKEEEAKAAQDGNELQTPEEGSVSLVDVEAEQEEVEVAKDTGKLEKGAEPTVEYTVVPQRDGTVMFKFE